MTGGLFAFGLGMWGAGASNKASKILGLTHDEISYKMKKGIDKLEEQGDPWAQSIIKDSKDCVIVFYDILDSILSKRGVPITWEEWVNMKLPELLK